MSWSVVGTSSNSFSNISNMSPSFSVEAAASNSWAEVPDNSGYVVSGYVVNDYIADGGFSDIGAASNIWVAV